VSTISAKIFDPQREHVTGYVHRFLITSLETHTVVDATDYTDVVATATVPSSPRVLRHPWFLLRLVVVYHGALRGSAGLVPARLNRQPTTGCPFRRRRIFLASERASDRLSSAERKVGACKTRRRVAGHLVCTRSLARPRRPWRESAFVLSHTPTYAGQRQPWLRPSSPRRFVYWLSCENRPTTCGFFDSASSPRPPLDLLLFFPPSWWISVR